MELKYIIDLDGTIYQQNRPIKFADKFISYLQKEGREFVFFTNSPEKSPLELKLKLSGFNIDVSEKQIITSGQVAIDYLLCHNKNCTVFVIGTNQLKNDFSNSGFNVVDSKSKKADYVVCGFSRGVDFSDIEAACRYIWNGAKLICTNFDESIPCENGLTPHTGAINASIEYATGEKAIVLGKPGSYTFEFLQNRLNAQKQELCVIGDRIDIDMLFGKLNGIKSFLVYTGITSEAEALDPKNHGFFDAGFKNLKQLMDFDKELCQGPKPHYVFSAVPKESV